MRRIFRNAILVGLLVYFLGSWFVTPHVWHSHSTVDDSDLQLRRGLAHSHSDIENHSSSITEDDFGSHPIAASSKHRHPHSHSHSHSHSPSRGHSHTHFHGHSKFPSSKRLPAENHMHSSGLPRKNVRSDELMGKQATEDDTRDDWHSHVSFLGLEITVYSSGTWLFESPDWWASESSYARPSGIKQTIKIDSDDEFHVCFRGPKSDWFFHFLDGIELANSPGEQFQRVLASIGVFLQIENHHSVNNETLPETPPPRR